MSKVFVYAGGGIGNQLFEYAMGLVVAKKTDASCWVDPVACVAASNRPYMLDKLSSPAPVASTWESRMILANRAGWQQRVWQILARRSSRTGSVRVGRLVLVRETRRGFNRDQQIPVARFLYLVGVWQSHLYWRGFEDVVRQAIQLPAIPNDLRTLAEEARTTDSVAVHVRRTDYLHQSHKFINHSMAYYRSAVHLLSETVRHTKHFVFSDDIQWCRKNMTFMRDARFVDSSSRTAMSELTLMSLCRHHIISNSTFSWWGAWLGSSAGITICPRRWYAEDGHVSGLYPEHWITIDA
jgi:hypothetical protein